MHEKLLLPVIGACVPLERRSGGDARVCGGQVSGCTMRLGRLGMFRLLPAQQDNLV